jgi:hypothetical protein
MGQRLDFARQYLSQALAAPSGVPSVGPLELARDFRGWIATQDRSGLEDGRPWITFEAERALRTLISSETRVFEYGSGGSTVFLASRVHQLVSVEHDPTWSAQVVSFVGGRAEVDVILAPPREARQASEMAYSSSSPAFAGQTFIDYVSVADRYPDGLFDLLIIDGRARTSAFFRASRVVRIGGAILLDDSERASYRPAVEAARRAGWPELGRYGPKRLTPSFARTTIWTKTSELPSEVVAPPAAR